MKTLLAILAWTLGALPLAVAAPPPADTPASPARAEVLVLGTYHFANPGRDVFNMEADDVLAPKRQAEIAQVIEVLKKFQPTKVAIEADYWSKRPKEYADYVAGNYTLTRNEIEQIGFRLARELGHKTVYAVDVDGDFPYQRVANYARAHDRTPELEAITGEIGKMVEAQGAYLAAHTVLETLLYMNADERVAQDVGFYYRQARFGNPGDWAGADLLTDWFRRNIRIYTNVVQLADAPTERVLVLYGAGHLGWLRQAFAANPDLRLRKLSDFAR